MYALNIKKCENIKKSIFQNIIVRYMEKIFFYLRVTRFFLN